MEMVTVPGTYKIESFVREVDGGHDLTEVTLKPVSGNQPAEAGVTLRLSDPSVLMNQMEQEFTVSLLPVASGEPGEQPAQFEEAHTS